MIMLEIMFGIYLIIAGLSEYSLLWPIAAAGYITGVVVGFTRQR